MTNSDDSEMESQTKAIIGNLLNKTDNDATVKSVISCFDPFGSKTSNSKSLNSSKFSVDSLEKCAVFLGIKLANKDNFKLFTKATLATRIVLSLMALLPSNCGECREKYVIEHEPEAESFFRCLKCMRRECHGACN